MDKRTHAPIVKILALVCVVAAAGVFGFVSRANAANFYFETSAFPIVESFNTDSNQFARGSRTNPNLESRGGIGFDSRTSMGVVFGNWLVGGGFNYSNAPSKEGTAGAANSISQSVKRLEYGATVGYVNRTGFRLTGTFLFGGNRKASEISYDGGASVATNFVYTQKVDFGYQVNLGYSFPLSSSLLLGPSLIYRNMTYKSETFEDAVTPSNNYTDATYQAKGKESELLPMVTIMLMF